MKLFMRLQEDEDFADAKCGCILQRSPISGYNAVPEFLMCSLHQSATLLEPADWVEIYYALQSKTTSPVVDGDKKWVAHLQKIMRKIGPDGQRMYGSQPQ